MSNLNLNSDDGREKIYINQEKYGEDRVIYVNLADSTIIARAKEAKNNIKKYCDGLSSENDIAGEMTEDRADLLIDKMVEADKYIREQVNYIFDYDVSDAVFGKSFATADINGKTYIERFLDAIMPLIESKMKKSNENMKKRVSKYTAKYVK